jgi:quinoprotein glucose dehydrogenase
VNIRNCGRMVDVVVQAGKTGFLYVFDRVTGQPIWPIEERPVPKSDMPGEQAWPTQPFPTAPPPFARQSFTEKDLSPYIDDPAEKARFLDDIRAARNEGLFTPPGLRNTIQMPGNNGGSNFGSAAVDPEHGTVVVVSKDWPALLKLSAPEGTAPANGDSGFVPYESPFGFMITSSGLTAIAPPWTSMTAYDLNAGTIKWKIPLGEVSELAARGIADTGSHFPKVGPVVTAGGLIFAGTRDRKVRALDIDTGKVLWTVEVDAGVEGMPSVYEVNGKQYIVYCAAAPATSHTHPPMYSQPARGESGETPAPAGRGGRGGRGGGGNIPGAYVAFALPDGVK